MASEVCNFCGARHSDTHITAIGSANPTTVENLQADNATYSISFQPDSMQFTLVKVASLAHAFKNNPIQACQTCEKIVWAVVKELQK
jgi:hypothetical protein